MPSETLTYIGAATGIIGALSGVSGVVVSVISYRRVKAIKTLDLRLELNRERNETQTAFTRLVDLKAQAIESRKAVAAATGRVHGGAMKQWQQQWEQDQERIEQLRGQIPTEDVDYQGMSTQDLEARLVELHRVKLHVTDLINKYEADLASDDADRARLHQEMLQRTQNNRP